jgi:hypothetical protein
MFKHLTTASLGLLAILMAFSVYACSLLGIYSVAGLGIDLPMKEGIALACAAGVLVLAHQALPLLQARVDGASDARYLWLYAVLGGLVLRLATWRFELPAIQVNDGLHYLKLANSLYLHQAYALDGYAFWPPGTPFIYTAFMHVFGQAAWLPIVVNCFFFLLAAASVRSLCRSLHFTPGQGALSVAVLAFWPALFLPSAQVSKEILLVGLVPTVLALLLVRRTWAALLAGGVAGLTILTQPSLMCMPAFLCAALAAARVPFKSILMRMALLVAGALIAIAPWSYRNYQIFGEVVPVSTNAGLVLHAGNQPAMVKPLGEVGGFLEPPAPPKPFDNDLLLSRWHKEQAIRFILTNKVDFARLVWHRLVITLGDDSDSAYRSLRLTDKVSNMTYLLFKALSNIAWMAIAALMAASCWAIRKREANTLAPLAILSAGATLYLMAVHGMAEGGARHHMAWSWAYAITLVGALALAGRRAANSLAPESACRSMTTSSCAQHESQL